MFKVVIILFVGIFTLMGSVAFPEESRIDPDKSTFYFVSRSGEEDGRPVLGEALQGRITFADKDGNPIAGIDGKDVQIISAEQGEMIMRTLSGKSQVDGYLYASFAPKNPKSVEKITIAVKAEDVVLKQIIAVNFYPASELVAQCQPLWNGPEHLYGSSKIGQSFVAGNINKITRIKVMAAKHGSVTAPVLKLYLWDTDYKTTVAKEPLFAGANPKTWDNPYWKKGLAEYILNCPVKTNAEYYFELGIPGQSGDKDNFFYVWRVWNRNDDSYPSGRCYRGGEKQPETDLTFYIFYPEVPSQSK